MSILYSCNLDESTLSKECNALVQTTICIPKGFVTHSFNVVVKLNDKQLLSYSEVLSHWQCQSVKWLHLKFLLITEEMVFTTPFELVVDVVSVSNTELEAQSSFIEDFTNLSIELNKNKIDFQIIKDNQKVICRWNLSDIQGISGQVLSTNTQNKILHANNKQIFAHHVNTVARIQLSNGHLVDFIAQYLIYPSVNLITGWVQIHNKKAALHPGGKWDLGDESSLQFGSLELSLEFSNLNKTTIFNGSEPPVKISRNESYKLTQHSSGGANWRSPTHVDATNEIPFTVKGYIEEINGISKEIPYRATPEVMLDSAPLQCKVLLKNFWQKFPSQLTIIKNSLNLGFFPPSNQPHELQGGEKSSHEFILDFSSDKFTNIVNKRPLQQNENSYTSLNIFKNKKSGLSDIISNSLDGENNFFLKRELIDQYGWRNFGDLYADHETAYYDGEDLFVSHYNNQYDPIFGFLKQYLLSNDTRWFELADDLAKHVKDIDMYHTTDDKAEYNGGLFWHTDHYLPAFTATHRSYSKHQDSNAYQDHAGGGGPGGQHCYTTGLMLHYLLTGNESSKQAVLTLSAWITCVYEGTNTCLELLLALKNRHVAGTKNHFTGQYPLDRGTANYIIALLDSFELTQERSYLTRVEHIISHTVHPNEDVKLRNLIDVENTWFYTVFLQAVCRYLVVKQQLDELDTNFYYSRDCLLNFANWMVKHEYMYLDKPDILEYPNDTWTAQDLRKATVFAAAHYFSPQQEQIYLDKAEYFENQVSSRLNTSTTKTYTRIMVLVLQNCGQVDFYKNLPKPADLKLYQDNWPAPRYANRGLLSSFVTNMAKRLCRLSLKNEINWLKKRLS